MATTAAAEATPTIAPPRSWLITGMLTLAVVTGLSLGSWYLFVDPEWSPINTYPFPAFAVLFWAILMVVFLGFNLEFWGFDRLTQPFKGLLLIGTNIGLSIGIVVLLAQGIGHFDARFAAERDDGVGYFAGALFVLFGFFTFVTVVVNWGHWPWNDMGLRQPIKGAFQIGSTLVPTLLLYVVLALPTMALDPESADPILALDTLIGWFYCSIVAMLITALLMENWPWRLAGPGLRTAVASLVGNFALGTIIYFALLGTAKAFIGNKTVGELGPGIDIFAAQIGACWNLWIILWANSFSNYPNGPSSAKNYIARVFVTLALGIGTFLAYYYVIAENVLHEPVVAGSLYGNALGFINWMVMWTLFYVVFLESFGMRQPDEEPATEVSVSH